MTRSCSSRRSPSAAVRPTTAAPSATAARALTAAASLALVLLLTSRAAAEDRTVFVLDRSSSMARSAPGGGTWIAEQEDAVATIAAALPATQRAGVVSFGNDARVDLALRALVTPADRAACGAAAGSLVADGGSRLGDGLDAALAMLRAAGARSGRESIVLFTDGGDTGSARDARFAVLPELVGRGVRVFAFALEPGADRELLLALARDSGGRSSAPTDAGARSGLIAQILPRLAPAQLVTAGDFRLAGSELGELSAPIDPGSEQAVFLAAAPGRDDDFELEVVTPSRVVLRSTTQIPGITFQRLGAARLLRVTAPEAGFWRVRVRADARLTGLRHVRVGVLVESSSSASVDWRSSALHVAPPASATLRAFASGFDALLPGQLDAELLDGEGLVLTRFALRDSGSALDGDLAAGDGEHAARFAGWHGVGEQTLRVHARGTRGGAPIQRCADLAIEVDDPPTAEPSFLSPLLFRARAIEGSDPRNRVQLELEFDLPSSAGDLLDLPLRLEIGGLELALEAGALRAAGAVRVFFDETRALSIRPRAERSSRARLTLDWRAFDGSVLGDLQRVGIELVIGSLQLSGTLLPQVDARRERASWAAGDPLEGVPWQILGCTVDRRGGNLRLVQRLERGLFDPTSDPLELAVEGWAIRVPAGAFRGGPRRYFFEASDGPRSARIDLDLGDGLFEIRGRGLAFFGAPTPLDLWLGIGPRSARLTLEPEVARTRTRY
jgi:hypothetical protein